MTYASERCSLLRNLCSLRGANKWIDVVWLVVGDVIDQPHREDTIPRKRALGERSAPAKLCLNIVPGTEKK